ncbi:phage tail tape measure protein, partial [Acutalibacter intestini]|uniref:phage tail tape measure protein n=1 Tax=Acutalibacter intestini TaxID=3093659 RepID=UPI002AC9404F
MAGKEDAIKTKVVVEGEKEYREACKGINASLREIGSEMKLVSAEFEGNEKSIEGLTAKQDVLNKRLEEQKKAVAAAEEALGKMRGALDKNDPALLKMQTNLNNAKAEMVRTQNELDKTSIQLEAAKKAGNNYSDSVNEIDRHLSALGAELKTAASEMGITSNKTETLAKSGKILSQIQEQQEEKIEQLTNAYNRAAQETGEFSEETVSLKQQLEGARQEFNSTQQKINELNSELAKEATQANEAAKAFVQYQIAAKEIDGTLGDLAAELKMVTAQYANSENKIEGITAKQEILNKALVEQKKKVEQAEAAYKTAVQQQGAMSEEAQTLQRALTEARTGMYETENQLDALNRELEEGTKKSADFSGAFSAMGAGLKAIGVGVAAIGTAIVAGIGYATGFADEVKSAMNDFEAATGIAEAAAKGFDEAMLNIYNNNFGENMEDIAAAMSTVAQTAKDLDPANIEAMTQNALMLRDTFGYDIQEQMRAVNMLMDQFGMSGEDAFNLIAQGAQNGLDKNGDLLDSINEYSVHFKTLGLDAEDMFNSFANGASAGTFSVDKLGDAVKEFGIRVKDGSDGTMQAFADIGVNAEETAAAFAAGGDQAAKAFEDVTAALFTMDDPLAQNAAGVALFGTMWEDLGVEGMKALTNLNGEISTTTDALSAINAVKYDDFGSAMS